MFDTGAGPVVTAWGLGFTSEEDPALVRARLGLALAEDGGAPTALIERLLQLSDFTHLMGLDPAELLETAAAFAAVAGWADAGLRAVAARLHSRHGILDADPVPPDLPGSPAQVERGGPAADDLAMRLGISRRRAARLVGEGRLYDDTLHPVGTALSAGVIDATKASAFADLLANQEPAVCFAVTEQVLPAAPGLPHHALRKRIQAVLIQADPTTAHHRAQLAATRRRLEHPRLLPDGQASLRLVAPAFDVAAVYTAAEAAAKAARAHGDPRTLDQLRADALTTLATAALSTGTLTSAPGCDTLLTVTVPTSTTSRRRTSGAGTDPPSLFGDLVEQERREREALETDTRPLSQVRRTLDQAVDALGAGSRQRLGHSPRRLGDQGPPSIAEALLQPGPRDERGGGDSPDPGPDDHPGEFPPFVAFSGTTSRLTLALAPEHLVDPGPDHIDPVDPWNDELALVEPGAQAGRFATYEAPETCRIGIDVPSLLGFAPLDPATARALAASPPRWLTITTAPADTWEAANESRVVLGAHPARPDADPDAAAEAGHDELWPSGFDPAPHLAAAGYRPGAELDRLVRTLHPTCVAPSCTVASAACDNDHVVEWPLGPTEARNLRPLCRHHHTLKTHHGHRYRVAPDGSTLWTTPSGYVYRRPPNGDSTLVSAPGRRRRRR